MSISDRGISHSYNPNTIQSILHRMRAVRAYLEHAPELAYMPDARTCILVMAKRDHRSWHSSLVSRARFRLLLCRAARSPRLLYAPPSRTRTVSGNRGIGYGDSELFLWPFGQLSSGKIRLYYKTCDAHEMKLDPINPVYRPHTFHIRDRVDAMLARAPPALATAALVTAAPG